MAKYYRFVIMVLTIVIWIVDCIFNSRDSKMEVNLIQYFRSK